MKYRMALISDIPQIVALQQQYHIDTIRAEDKADGFVTTRFTVAQFESIIRDENGVTLALDRDKVIGYAMAASWHYWSQWPFFRHMIAELSLITYLGKTATPDNSYQYGPVCIDKNYRGQQVLPNIFELSRQSMAERYAILLTFINHNNPRSYKAHVDKLGLEVIRNFEFNNNHYYELAYDASRPIALSKEL